MSEKLKVGILGATGMVGQRFISLLENHPWFQVVTVAASPRSAGKTYQEAVGGRWKMDTPMPEAVKNLIVMNVNEVEKVASTVDFVFSAVDMTKEEIKAIEEEYAKTETPVVSNNSAHRWTPDVPMVIPEINPEHFEVIKHQKERLGTKRGFIAVKPNCSIQSYAPVLTAWKEFEPYEVVATTYQAISGAGKTFKDWPEMEHNIIPYIGGEEEKSEKEPLRIWGTIQNGEIVPAKEPVITCQCVRVPILNGHTAAVFVKFRKKPTKEQLVNALREFKGIPQELQLPSAPKQFIQYLEEDNRPQVTADVDFEHGMGVSVGRLREDTVYGGLIVMDEDTCMVDIAKFFLEFTVDESCGKCTPCRVGTKRLYEMLDKITKGEGTLEDLDKMEELCYYIKDNALCGLGQTAQTLFCPHFVISEMSILLIV